MQRIFPLGGHASFAPINHVCCCFPPFLSFFIRTHHGTPILNHGRFIPSNPCQPWALWSQTAQELSLPRGQDRVQPWLLWYGSRPTTKSLSFRNLLLIGLSQLLALYRHFHKVCSSKHDEVAELCRAKPRYSIGVVARRTPASVHRF
jgi:hypothetical protein